MANKIKRSNFVEYHQYSNNQLGDRFRKRDSGGRWRRNESPASVRRTALARQDRARRAAVKERRAGFRAAGAALDAVPGILSSVLGIALSICLLVPLFGILVNGNDMTDYFEGDKSGIYSVAVPETSDKFYMFGVDPGSFTVERPTGENVSVTMVTGKHFSVSDTLDWVKQMASDLPEYAVNPIAYGAKVFWNFAKDTLAGLVTGENSFVDEEGKTVFEQWATDAMDGFTSWWRSLWGKE